jgi:hypothetical protein
MDQDQQNANRHELSSWNIIRVLSRQNICSVARKQLTIVPTTERNAVRRSTMDWLSVQIMILTAGFLLPGISIAEGLAEAFSAKPVRIITAQGAGGARTFRRDGLQGN